MNVVWCGYIIHTYKGQQTIAILIQPLDLLPTLIVDEVDVLLDVHISKCGPKWEKLC